MRLINLISVNAVLAATVAAQSACSGQQYNPAPGYPAYNSGCYPTSYYATSDLGNTRPSDAQTRCSAQCTDAGSQCGSYVAQLNKAADSDNYSGTCFFFTSNPAPPPRRCANTAYLLIGYDKDNTNACFSSSTKAASSFCSSYLGIPLVTVTKTPPVVTSTVTTVTQPATTDVMTVESTASATTTVTSYTTIYTTDVQYLKRGVGRSRRAVASPACITPGTPSSRLSAACSCLSIKPSTTTTTLAPAVTYTTLTQTSVMTVVTTVTEVTVTLTYSSFTTDTATKSVKIRCSTDNGFGCSTVTLS